MTSRTIIIGAVICGMVMYASVVPVHGADKRGDANGDTKIDILDAQMVVAHLLAGGHLGKRADANSDGRVDVLDLQRLLARMTQVSSRQVPAPSAPPPGKAVFTSAQRSCPKPDLRQVGVVRLEPDTVNRCLHRVRVVMPATMPNPKTERYLFTLTPNAPPVLA